MKKAIIHIAKGMGIFVLCLILAVTSLAAVYTIPTDSVKENVAKSAVTFQAEGNYPRWHRWCRSLLDNYTDCLMCLIAEYKTDDSVFVDAMNANYHVFEKTSTVETVVAHYIDGVEYDNTREYSRYWHGYLVYLKPLLTVFTYRQIRIINTVTLTLLLGVLFLLLFKNRKELVLPFLITILIAGPLIIMNSLQYSHCFYIMIISSIFMLILEKRSNFSVKALYLLFITGICTAFFDFLTYPIATYCIPATLYIYMTQKGSFKDTSVNIVKTGAVWAVGYFGFWASKWVVGSAILGHSILGRAVEAAQTRVSSSGLIVTVVYNVVEICLTPFMLLAVAFFLFAIIKTIRVRTAEKPGFKAIFSRFIIPYAIPAVLPLIWFVVLQNHSYAHHFFTHKALLGTVFALLVMAADLYRNYQGYFQVRNQGTPDSQKNAPTQ